MDAIQPCSGAWDIPFRSTAAANCSAGSFSATTEGRVICAQTKNSLRALVVQEQVQVQVRAREVSSCQALVRICTSISAMYVACIVLVALPSRGSGAASPLEKPNQCRSREKCEIK